MFLFLLVESKAAFFFSQCSNNISLGTSGFAFLPFVIFIENLAHINVLR